MTILDNIRLLYCLNEAGVDKAHELLEGLLLNQECRQTTPEQLQQQIIEEKSKIMSAKDKAGEEKAQERNTRKQEIRQQHESEFMIIGRQKAFYDQEDMIKNICQYNDSEDIWTASRSYNWGYVQGIRTERARRKKVAL